MLAYEYLSADLSDEERQKAINRIKKLEKELEDLRKE